MYYFNPESGGFIDSAAWGTQALPDGAIEISAAEYKELFAGVSMGKKVELQNGRPALIDPPALTYEQQLARTHAQRRTAYVAESDPIKNEADYDALVNGAEPDYTAWKAAVDVIKARYPLPAAPEPEIA